MRACRAPAAGGFNPDAFADFSDILGDFFGFGDLFGSGGGGRRRSRAQRGEDVRYDLEISFEDAVFGMNAEIQVPRMERCERCKGAGIASPAAARAPAPPATAAAKSSTSRVSFRSAAPAAPAAARARSSAILAAECRGHGYRQVQRKLKVNIPAGVDDGTRLRLASEGQPGANGGPPGDLYVFLKVKQHAFFERHENDLHCTIPLNIAQAALGCEIDVPDPRAAAQAQNPRRHAERRAVQIAPPGRRRF